jgi:peptide/nickel transport system substrate-binding protein
MRPSTRKAGGGWGRLALTVAVLILATLVGGAVPEAGAVPPDSTLLLNMSSSDVDSVDPARAYYAPSWQILYASCAMLVNYPDAAAPLGSRLQAELATGLPTVTNAGKTYTFTIRDDYRFSSGAPVTAADVKATFDRLADPATQSPAQTFTSDIAEVVANGNQVAVTLTRPAPDLLARLAMQFFCVLPAGTPTTELYAFPSAGPYYIESRTPNGPIVLQRNPNYAGPRPHFFQTIKYAAVNTNPDTSMNQILAGDIDYDPGGMPPTADQNLWNSYGPDSEAAARGAQQYFVNPTLAVRYLALNTTAGRIFSNPTLRKAVNFAIDRPEMIALRGGHAGRVTDHFLPPGAAGFRDDSIYPLDGPDFDTAQALVDEAGGAGPVTVYTTTSPIGVNQGELIKADLETVGFTVTVEHYATATVYSKCGTRTEPFDICNVGWIADYGDPYDFMFLFDGRTIKDTNNNDYSYFDDADFNANLDAAQALSGDARYAAFGDLDAQLRDAAPGVAWDNDNNRDFFAARIGCQKFQPIYGIDLAALCLRPEIAAGDARLTEGNSGASTLTFDITRTRATAPGTLSYATEDGTATAGSDYAPISGQVEFGAGEFHKTVAVEVYGDTTVEPDETVLMRLSAPTAGTLTRPLAVGTIVNDDVAPLPPPPPPVSPPPPPPPPPPPAAVCTAPNVRGQTLAAARAALAIANCSTGRTTTRFSSVVRKGRVISQSARPGTQLDYGAAVDLVISKGRRPPVRVTLCHRGHTIKVPRSQVKKHLKQGDRRGACRKPRRR